MRTGRVDRNSVVRSLERNTSLRGGDAQDVAIRIEMQVNNAKGDVQSGAMQAAKTTGKVMWGIFGALALGLIAAVAGGLLGARRQPMVVTRRREPLPT
jgi:hypothetical protein